MRYALRSITLLILFFPTVVSAQKRIYVNEYLNIGVGGKGLSLAGAQSASTNDVTSAYWNPAGLMNINADYQVGLMHAEYFSGNAKYDYAAIAMPLKGKNRTLAFSALRYATDDIAYTIDYVQPDGSFDDTKLRSISAGDYAFFLSYAQGLRMPKRSSWQMNLGVNGKIIYRHIGSMANAWGAGLDVGLQAVNGKWRIGLMAKDITTTYTSWSFHLTDKEKQVFGETHNDIPVKSYEVMTPRMNIGIARSMFKDSSKFSLVAEIDGDITTDGKRNTLLNNADVSLDPHMGLELGYKHTVFLRLGVGNFQKVLDDKDTMNLQKYTLYQPSIGLGVRINALNIDYAFTSLQTQASPLYSHIISLRLDLMRASKRKKSLNSDTIPSN